LILNRLKGVLKLALVLLWIYFLLIVIALVGLMLTGILVAVAVPSGTVALAAHDAAIKVK
jgi:hypothetical protein